jgi:two-component system CheB/CheR fusion protein
MPDPLAPDPSRLQALEAENAQLREKLAEAERRGEQLRSELQHRVRNVLAIVRSIARRTALTSETAESYALHLQGRLGAIARAQGIAVRDPGDGVDLRDMIAEELLAQAVHEGKRLSLSGPPLRLRDKVLATMALAMHELAVNAVKYGALSNPQGRIAVSWRVETGPALRLEWRELGGPAPDAAARRIGFGTELIERMLPYELDAAGSLSFDGDGAYCAIVVPLTTEITILTPCATPLNQAGSPGGS